MILYIRDPRYPKWCELNAAGGDRHETVCEATMPASEPVVITATPAPENICDACRAVREQWTRTWESGAIRKGA